MQPIRQLRAYLQQRRQLSTIRPHVDAEFYLSQAPSAADHPGGVAAHYLSVGAAAGLNPDASFDTGEYLRANPDVAASGLNPLYHFLRFGQHEDRRGSPIADPVKPEPAHDMAGLVAAHFDAALYLEQCPEAETYAGGPAQHYLDQGEAEGLQPTRDFSGIAYLRQNPDVAATGMNGFYHYLAFGQAEGRELGHPPSVDLHRAISRDFDADFYLARYPDVAKAGADPMTHFRRRGIYENRLPNAHFDPQYYRRAAGATLDASQSAYQHFLEEGRDRGLPDSMTSADAPIFRRFAQLNGWEPEAAAVAVRDRRQALIDSLLSGPLRQQLEKLEQVDPLVMKSFGAGLRPGISPVRNEAVMLQVSAILEAQQAAQRRPAKAVVVMPWSHLGGASKLAGMATRLLADRFGPDEIVVIHTESAEFDYSQWFPEGIRVIDLYSPCLGLPRKQQSRVLLELLRSLRPELVLNINSRLCWETFQNFGKPLSNETRLLAYMFCGEKDARGHWSGYPISFYHTVLDVLDGVLVESHSLQTELSERYLLSDPALSKLTVLETPADPQLAQVQLRQRPEGARPAIFWAGRFARQKRLDLVEQIALRMPDCDFHLWGGEAWPGEKPDNLMLHGTYQDLTELPLQGCDAWLYTAEWDGVPNMLIEIATLGVPLVGSLAGGTGEVLLPDLAVGVAEIDDIDAYVAGLRQIIDHPEQAAARAARLRQTMLQKRTPQAYAQALNAVLDQLTPRSPEEVQP
ncbi:hypothetical protein [Paracoccus jeotgali]|uniref:hypothetical protein n=1 Tax=Paracoccus jeotgali TaxID=2065379 RepID=UPI0028B22BCC|nr:hypothetical protein [Paracoccus jeotgali]